MKKIRCEGCDLIKRRYYVIKFKKKFLCGTCRKKLNHKKLAK
jgi:hypothetical protein